MSNDHAAYSVSNAFERFRGPATTEANKQFAQAIDHAEIKGEDAFDEAVGSWSYSGLKAIIDTSGVPVVVKRVWWREFQGQVTSTCNVF